MPPLFAFTELLAITVTTFNPPKKPLTILANPRARRSLFTLERLFLGSNLSTALMLNKDSITAIKVMENCLRDANVLPSEVDAINMHGTSTPLGDIAESNAIIKVFKEHAYAMNINSTKSMTGHLLGAAGAIESIASILAMKHGIVPPTINHSTIDENINPELNLTLNTPQKRDIKVAMSNTFGFGGHNACVAFKKIDE